MAKQKLIENVLVPASRIIKLDIPLTEALVEGYKALAVYRFPFTRPGQKNLNGRIYPFKLWDRVFQLFRTGSTVSLCNHPEADGDPARIWAVLRNPGYSEDRIFGLVDCYILDNELGRTAQGVLLAGGDLGLSSCGTGDFEADGVTVDSDTFELERFFDWVLNPSYSVFGTLDDQISEAVMADSTKNNENDPGKVREAAGGGKTLSLREKRDIEVSFKRIYEDVKGISSVRERLVRAREALTFYEGTGVEFYKGEFEELVKEAEEAFDAGLAKGEQVVVDKKEAEGLKKENEELRKKNEELKKQAENFKKLRDDADDILTSMSEITRRSIPYEKYEELRRYTLRVARMYSEMKNDRNLFQTRFQEMLAAAKALEAAQMVQYQKDAAAKARVDELWQRSADAKALAEKRLREAREIEFMRGVNPEVLEYYNDLIRMGENVEGIRTQILSKRTLLEAQMLVLKARRQAAPMAEAVPIRDLSAPLPVRNCRQIMPDIPMLIPKGFI
jgi:hypothetical protein